MPPSQLAVSTTSNSRLLGFLLGSPFVFSLLLGFRASTLNPDAYIHYFLFGALLPLSIVYVRALRTWSYRENRSTSRNRMFGVIFLLWLICQISFALVLVWYTPSISSKSPVVFFHLAEWAANIGFVAGGVFTEDVLLSSPERIASYSYVLNLLFPILLFMTTDNKIARLANQEATRLRALERERIDKEREAARRKRLQERARRQSHQSDLRREGSSKAIGDKGATSSSSRMSGLDLFACRRCGTCYRKEQIDDRKAEWCSFCIEEFPESIVAGGISALPKNFEREARRAKRERMASRRGWKFSRIDGPPQLASDAYQEGWIDGYLTVEELESSGH
jgi:hypothetical protein